MTRKNGTLRRRPQGIALVFSLIIVSLVTLIGLGITFIITRELRLSSNLDHATSAYYAADSGVERGLYRVKLGQTDTDETLQELIAAIQTYTGALSFSNASYTDINSAIANPSEQVQDLVENQSIQFDFSEINPPGAGANIQSIAVQWDDGSSTAETLELSLIGWSLIGTIQIDQVVTKQIIRSSDLGVADNTIAFNGIGGVAFASNKFYRIRVKAIGNDVSPNEQLDDVQFTAYANPDGPYYAGPGTITVIPSSTAVTIKGQGTRGDFSQAITATIPWRLALSGIFDYVIFSEQDLIKSVAVVTNPPIYRTGQREIEAGIAPTGTFCTCLGVPACSSTAWLGGCDAGGSPSVQQVTQCNAPSHVGTCSVNELLGSGSNPAGFSLVTNPSTLAVPAGSYYMRVSGHRTGPYDADARIRLDDDLTSAGSSPYIEEFTPPADSASGTCNFNCLFSLPVRIGSLCTGGSNDGFACTVAGDCPGGSCHNYQRAYLLGGASAINAPTYFDWYSLTSSPLLTSPTDKYCKDLTQNECLP